MSYEAPHPSYKKKREYAPLNSHFPNRFFVKCDTVIHGLLGNIKRQVKILNQTDFPFYKGCFSFEPLNHTRR